MCNGGWGDGTDDTTASLTEPPDPAAAAPIAYNIALAGKEYHHGQWLLARDELRACYLRLQQHGSAEAEYLRRLREAEERIHQDLKRWADLVNPKLSDEHTQAVEVNEYCRRQARGAEYE